jgi:hypothetical protein
MKNNNLPEEFKKFIAAAFGDEGSSWDYDSIDPYGLIKRNKPFKDRLQYIKTEYLTEDPPSEGGSEYRLIFKDLECPNGTHYAFHTYMSSWYEYEYGNELCELERWKMLRKTTKEVTVYEEV